MNHVIAIISCAVGALFGGIGAGTSGAVTGIVTGYAVGYFYARAVFTYRGPAPLRFLLGVLGGTLAGGISGTLVHVPAFLGLGKSFWSTPGKPDGMLIGGAFGLFAGTVLGLIIITVMLISERIKK